jgi:hypothetical protein
LPCTDFPKPLHTGVSRKWSLFLGVIERIHLSLPSWGPLPRVKPGPAEKSRVRLPQRGAGAIEPGNAKRRGSVEPLGSEPSGVRVACGSSGPRAFSPSMLAGQSFERLSVLPYAYFFDSRHAPGTIRVRASVSGSDCRPQEVWRSRSPTGMYLF